MFTTPDLEPGKTYTYKIEALIEPNNYTKITRPREVTFKAGETVNVDVRKEDKKLGQDRRPLGADARRHRGQDVRDGQGRPRTT